MAQANASFSDVSSDYWARPFIERLAKQDIIAGFPDGTFKPDQAVTRAQFAAIVRKAFDKSAVRNNRDFSDIPAKYWAISAIAKAYTTGFLSGYPDGTFRPEQQIPKVQALISLSSGLQLDPPNNLEKSLSIYRDASDIPDYARKGMGAATQNTLVVNYPNRTFLNPTDTATRADIAAFVYQALVNQKKLPALPSGSKAVAYIVNYANNGNGDGSDDNNNGGGGGQQGNRLVSQGTLLPVKFPGGNNVKLIIAPGETVETSLETSQVIRGPRGGVLIPVGSRIQGSFQPINLNNTQLRGTQYFARSISINGQNYVMNATSDPFIPTAQQALSPGLLQGGFATSAAQILLGGLFGGGANLSGILGGVLGTGNGATPQPFPDNQNRNVIVVDTSNLILKVQNDFKVALKLGRTLQ
ncbi:MAG TPA: S-layer homology domain-containing protein [Stenomitos sp.]